MLAYRSEIYLWVIAHIFPFIMMGVWTTAAQGGDPTKFSLTPADYGRYFVAIFIVRQFSVVWMIYEFEWHIVEGRLSYFLLRPMNALWHYVSGHFAEQAARFPFFVGCVILFFLLYPTAFWWPTPASVIFGIVAIYAAFSLRFALQYCFAMANFWMERASAIDSLSYLPYVFLSGMVAPLSDYSPGVAAFAMWTPFPYLLYFPAQIMMGKLTPSSPGLWQGFGIMALWFLALSALGSFLWHRGLRRFSAQGG